MNHGEIGSPFDKLPNEIVLKIFSYVDPRTFYSIHVTCKRFFEILADLNLTKDKAAKQVANTRLNAFVLSENFNSVIEKDKCKKFYYFNEYYNEVRGKPHEYIILDTTKLNQKEIQHLVTYYKNEFRYNLTDNNPYVYEDITSVVLSYNFLEPFYQKKKANFRVILLALKMLGFEPTVNFKSIHEIRSLEKQVAILNDSLYLENYINVNPSFDSRFAALRRYTSEFTLRPRSSNI